MPKTLADPTWMRAAPVGVGGEALWLHDCGAIALWPVGVSMTVAGACKICSLDHGRWRPVLVESDQVEPASTSLADDGRRMRFAMRMVAPDGPPGASSQVLVWRWRHLDDGTAYSQLPAHVNATDPRSRWVREVAVQGSAQGHWWPADEISESRIAEAGARP